MTTAILTKWPGGYTFRYDLVHPLMARWQRGNDSSTRVVYDPTWCQERPYKTYRGSAQQIFATLHEAIRYLGYPDIATWRFVP